MSGALPAGTALRPDDLYALRVAEDPRMSPDGRHVVFVMMTIDRSTYAYRRSLHLAASDGGGAVVLTDGGNDSTPRWSPDGSRIAFIRTPAPDVKPKSAEEAERGVHRPQLWVCDADGSNQLQLTHLAGGATDPVWSPDGRAVVVTSQVGAADDLEAEQAAYEGRSVPAVRTITRLWYRADGLGFTYERRAQLMLVPAAGGVPRALTDGDWDSRMPSFSPDGTMLAFVSDRSETRFRWPGGAVWLLDLRAGAPPRRLTPEPISAGRPVWSPDGSQIAYRGVEVLTTDGYVELYLVEAGGGEPRLLSEDFLPTCGNICLDDQRVPPGPDEPMWSPDGAEVWLCASAYGSVHLWAVRTGTGEWRQLTTGHRNVFAVTVDATASRLALGVSSPSMPGDVFVHDLADDEERRITRLNDELFAERSLAGVAEYSVRASDGEVVHGWVMRPPGAAGGTALPGVLQIHGGPHAMYGWSFCFEFQLLAAHGLAVVYGNPRGSVGYGRRFARSIAGHWGERDFQDLLDLMDGAIARGGIDSARTAVAGGSYGGYMTLWMLGHDPDRRWKTGVAMRPLSNWASFFGMSDIGARFTMLSAGGVPWRDLDLLMRHSPITFVEKMHAPLLLLHSDNDLRCPIAEAEQLFGALAYLGREVRFVRFEQQSHDLSRGGHPRSREIRLRLIAEWLRDHLNGSGAAPAATAGVGS